MADTTKVDETRSCTRRELRGRVLRESRSRRSGGAPQPQFLSGLDAPGLPLSRPTTLGLPAMSRVFSPNFSTAARNTTASIEELGCFIPSPLSPAAVPMLLHSLSSEPIGQSARPPPLS